MDAAAILARLAPPPNPAGGPGTPAAVAGTAGTLAAELDGADAAAACVLAGDECERLALTDLSRALHAAAGLVELADHLAARRPGVPGVARAQGRARRALAQSLCYANRFDEAIHRLDESEALCARAAPVEAARAGLTRVHALARLGRLEEAVRAGEDARARLMAHGAPDLAARADVNIGVVRRMKGDAAGAIVNFERAAPHFAEQPAVLAQVESNRAEALLDTHRFADARAAFERALAALTAAGATRAAAIVEGNLADLAGRQGRYTESVERFERARRALVGADAPGDAARLAVERAEVLLELGERAAAEEGFASAVETLKARAMAWEEARANLGLARALTERGAGSGAPAQRAFDAAAAGFAGLGHTPAAARVRVARAEAALASGDDGAEKGGPRAALALLDVGEVALTLDAVRADLLASAAHLALGDAPASSAAAERALRRATDEGVTPLVADAHHARARAHRAAGERADALRNLEAAAAATEAVRGALRGERFRAAFMGKRAAIFNELATATLDDGAPGAIDRAFSALERGNARALLDLVSAPRGGDEKAADAGGAGLAAELARAREELAAVYSRLHDLPRSGAGVHSPVAAAWRAALAERESAVAELERRAAPSARPHEARPVTLEAARAGLASAGPESGAFAVFFAEGERLSALWATACGAGVVRGFAGVGEVVAAAEEVRFQVARAQARGLPGGTAGERLLAEARAALGALHALVLAPLLSAHGGGLARARRVCVVPAECVQGVPWSALWDGAAYTGDGRFFVVSPSVSVAVGLSRLGQAADQTARVVAVGVADDAAPRMEEEARRVAAHHPGGAVLTGSAATRAAVLQAAAGAGEGAAGGVGLLHLATHAAFSSRDPMGSAVRLADGWLTARDLSGLAPQGGAGPSVVLSSCDSGRVVASVGGEAWGLVRVLLSAGCPRVVGALWPVHDQSAVEFMDAFHGALYLSGRSPLLDFAGASSDARVGVRSKWPHPAAWAAFEVFGAP
jgi:tetratricopeptide (TPR) repeat protein